MTRIDRYLLFLYVRVLVICFTSLTGLLIVVQVFSNLDEFMRYAKQHNHSLAAVLVEYYGPYSLTIFDRLSGLIALLALLFVIAWLYRTNEFTALMAAGVTKWRVTRPLLIASACVILAAVLLREVAIPQFQDKLDRSPQDLSGEVARPIKPTFDHRTSALLQGRHLLPAKQEIVAPSLRFRDGPIGAACGRQILAGTATYEVGKNGRPTGYKLRHITVPKNIDSIESVYALDGSPLLLTRKDTDWLEPNSVFWVSETEYEMLRGGNAWKQFASTSELISHLQLGLRTESNALRIQIHQRFVRPFIDGTLLLLAIPVLLTRNDRHVFMVAGSCLILVTGFTGVVLGLAGLGGAGYLLDPLNAIWLPLVVFLPWGWMRTTQAMES
jgi:lipopolysaccharide export system permease protein